ncbi:MAG: class I SAM-dependent methyltransferase [Leptospiraceae bacterium]|nr:class I SAM-dependent methyltransferase [Leptospiraceae bacterium]
MNTEYIHSFTESEQQRLVAQAEFLAHYTHPFLEFSPSDSVLEIGCGVGAQIKLLSNSHSYKKIVGIDFEPKQIEKAKQILLNEIKLGKVELAVGSGTNLPYADESFDVVYIFFVLEHFYNPSLILQEIKRVLKPGGKFFCTEVYNSGISIFPANEYLTHYWDQFNKLQTRIGGNPDIGIQLGNLCIDAGFIVDKFQSSIPILDKRMKSLGERKRFLNMWETLFVSGYSLLCEKGMIEEDADTKISLAFEKILLNEESIFLYSLWQVLAIK